MPFYENEICPVCNKKFGENDDIVICPVCGTPHHRECYKSNGKCVNSDKHGTDFEYQCSAKSAEDKQKENSASYDNEVKNDENENHYYDPQYHNQEKDDSKTVCSQCGAEIDKDAPFCKNCGARQSTPQYQPYKPVMNSPFAQKANEYKNNKQTVDGKSLADIAAVVRSNVKRFVPKFIKNKKCSWNWGAFIFGPYYLLYRKMYKQGILAMAVQLIASLVIQGFYAEPYAEFANFFNANYEALYSSNISDELLTQFSSYYDKIMPMMLLLVASTLIINIVIALFSDRLYRTRVMEIIDNVDKKLDEGAMFSQNPMFGDGSNLSQDEMRTLYLGKSGGVSFFAPVIAFFVLDIITTLISSL